MKHDVKSVVSSFTVDLRFAFYYCSKSFQAFILQRDYVSIVDSMRKQRATAVIGKEILIPVNNLLPQSILFIGTFLSSVIFYSTSSTCVTGLLIHVHFIGAVARIG